MTSWQSNGLPWLPSAAHLLIPRPFKTSWSYSLLRTPSLPLAIPTHWRFRSYDWVLGKQLHSRPTRPTLAHSFCLLALFFIQGKKSPCSKPHTWFWPAIVHLGILSSTWVFYHNVPLLQKAVTLSWSILIKSFAHKVTKVQTHHCPIKLLSANKRHVISIVACILSANLFQLQEEFIRKHWKEKPNHQTPLQWLQPIKSEQFTCLSL